MSSLRVTIGRKVHRVAVGPQATRVTIPQVSNTRVRVTQGTIGPQGATGPGVPVGGAAGQLLGKVDSTDYNTEWVEAVERIDQLGDALAADTAVDFPNTHPTFGNQLTLTGVSGEETTLNLQSGSAFDPVKLGFGSGYINFFEIAVGQPSPRFTINENVVISGSLDILDDDIWLNREGLGLTSHIYMGSGGPSTPAMSFDNSTKHFGFSYPVDFNEINTDTISELTPDTGVTIDGLRIKDGQVYRYDAHLINTNNPHHTTAALVGAAEEIHTHLEADITDLGAYITDAPSDGNEYVRKDAAWAVSSGGGAVSSVFGRTGDVVALTGDYTTAQVVEATNLYYTEARVDANTSVAANTAARHVHTNKTELDLVTDGDHDVRTDNPHGVTYAQVGAAPTAHTHDPTIGLSQGGATDGQALLWDAAAAKWAPSTLASAVESVFGRTGVVAAQTGDYTWAQINKATSSLADLTTRSHTDLTDVGTNTHAQLDTHLALTNEHVDWTDASENFKTSGLVTSTYSSSASGSAVMADLGAELSGVYTAEINGVDVDLDYIYAAGAVVLGKVRGFRFRYDVVDNGAALANGAVQIIDGRINANGVAIDANTSGQSPMYYSFSNPHSGQTFNNGFMRVTVASGASGESISFYSDMTVGGTAKGIGYKGYAGSNAGATGILIGVQGIIYANSSSVHSSVVALEGYILSKGATLAENTMGLRINAHGLVNNASFAITSATTSTPANAATDHCDFANNTGELFVAGIAEIDGELFADSNISHGLDDVSSTPHTTATAYTMIDASGGNHVENLPLISSLSGNREVVLKKTDSSSNTVTVTPGSGDDIDGASTKVLSGQNEYVRLIAGNSTTWHVVG